MKIIIKIAYENHKLDYTERDNEIYHAIALFLQKYNINYKLISYSDENVQPRHKTMNKGLCKCEHCIHEQESISTNDINHIWAIQETKRHVT